MRKSPIVLFLLCCLFFGLSSSGLAYDARTTHPHLTQFAVEFYNENFPQRTITKGEQQWLIQGSIDEDKGLRKINHFYDPIFKETWKLGGTENLIPALTAKEWSQNPLVQSFYDPVYLSLLASIAKTVIFKKWSPYNPIYWSALVSFVSSPARSKANYTWQRAIYEYVKGNKKMAFESLGHVLHLIQDMSVPSHTRENISIPFLKGAIDPYEVYTSRNNIDFYFFLKNKIKNKQPLSKKTLNAYFDYSALYSNKYFYSADTIATSRYSYPEVIFPDVPEVDKNVRKIYLLGYDENKQLFHLARKKMGWRFQSGFNNYTIEDEKVLQDYWERLAPQAVLNGAGIINLFFQKVEEAKNDPAFIASNERSKLDTLLGNVGNLFSKVFKRNPNYILVEDTDSLPTPISNSSFSPEASSRKTPVSTTLKKKEARNIPSLTTTTTLPSLTNTTLPSPTTSTTKEKTPSFCSYSTHSFPLRNKVIINEVAWMGSKDGYNNEWIELKNISSGLIDISGWQILSQRGRIKFIFPGKTKITSGSFLLLERADDNSVPGIKANFIYSGSLSNSSEGLHLFDDSCQLEDEVLANPSWPAGSNSSKRTMERSSNFSWHDYEGDSVNNIYGTPRRENSQPQATYSGGSNSSSTSSSTTTTTPVTTTTTTTTVPSTSTTIPTYPPLLITEIKVAGKDEEGSILAHDEFVEIYNSSEADIDLTGYYLQKKTAQGLSFSSLLSRDSLKGKVISARGFFLAGHASSTIPLDAVWSSGSLTDNNTLVLKDPQGKIVDKVGWGEANDCEGNCAPSFLAGQSIQRKISNGEFLDTDDNSSDFTTQDCPSPGATTNDCSSESTEPTVLSANADSFHSFSWHPFTANSSRIVLEFDTDSYPFIQATEDTNNIFTAMVFYFNQDVPGSEKLGSLAVYLSNTKNVWTVNGDNIGLLVSYPSYYSGFPKLGSIIFTSAESYAAGAAIPRKYAYNIASLPANNHFIVDVKGVSNGQGSNFSENDYVTIGLYGYDKHLTSYLRLVGFDNTKYYFQPDKFYHPPGKIEDFSVSFSKNNLVNNIISSSSSNPVLYFDWSPSSDEDINDVLKYEIHYVFKREGDDINNNDLTKNSWTWSASQLVPGEPTQNSEGGFDLEVPLSNLDYIYKYRPYPVEATTTMYWAIRAKDSLGLLSPLSPISQLVIFPPVISSE